MIRLIIADDHEIVRRGLRLTISGEADIILVGEAKNGVGVLELLSQQQADVLLMDIQMPEKDGITTAREAHEKYPDLKILILSNYSEQETVYSALRANITGYLLKDVSGDELLEAIRGAARGEPQLHPAIARHLMNNVPAPVNPVESLSAREKEILALIGKGKSNKEIAVMLGLSEATIKGYTSSIFEKMHVADRTQAALLAVRYGVITQKDLTEI